MEILSIKEIENYESKNKLINKKILEKINFIFNFRLYNFSLMFFFCLNFKYNNK